MRPFLVCVVVLGLAGCASIVSKSDYPVSINTNPAGAQIVISDDEGNTVFEGTTPTTVTLSTKKGFFSGNNYTIQASLPGHQPASMAIARSIDGWYFANLLFGGVIGMLIVDPATGAMWKLNQSVVLNLVEAPPEATDGLSLRVLTISDVPEDLRSDLIPLASWN